jgi:hypothetical protein
MFLKLIDVKKNNVWKISFLVGTGIICLIFVFLPIDQKSVVNAFTLFGTFISIFGLTLAFKQIKSVNEVNEKTKKAIEKSLLRINQILSISDLSKANKIIQEIQTALISNKLEIVLLRMRDLKTILIQVKYNEDLDEYIIATNYNQNITDIASDINNVHYEIINNNQRINVHRIHQTLEKIATILSDFENKLKHKKYDT